MVVRAHGNIRRLAGDNPDEFEALTGLVGLRCELGFPGVCPDAEGKQPNENLNELLQDIGQSNCPAVLLRCCRFRHHSRVCAIFPGT